MARPTAAPSDRTRVRRLPDRAAYDAASVAAVVDAALLAHVGFTHEGSVHVIPTAVWREGDHLHIHGAKASRMLQALVDSDCCVTLSIVDGLVMARSAFHHSMNYRSLVVYGRFEPVEGPAAKFRSLQAFMDKLAPGRWNALRPVTEPELNATTVLRLSLAEASVKARSGGPKDDEADLDWPVWAGVVPLALKAGEPQVDGPAGRGEPPVLGSGALA